MDPKFEERLSDPRPLTESELCKLLDAVSTEVGSMPPTAQNPVVLTTALIRYRLRKALRGAFPRLSVLSYQELTPDMNIQPIARISLEEGDESPPNASESVPELRLLNAETIADRVFKPPDSSM